MSVTKHKKRRRPDDSRYLITPATAREVGPALVQRAYADGYEIENVVDKPGVLQILICSPAWMPEPLPGNVHGVCALCGKGIYWRPHAPKQLKRICSPCARAMGLRMPNPGY